MIDKLNTIVWGFDYKVGNEIINSIKKKLNVDFIVSDHRFADYKKRDFIFNIKSLDFETNNANFNLKEYFDFRRKNFSIFNLVMSIRGNEYSDLSEVNNEFFILYCFFNKIVEKKKISLIIFSAPPHEGPDLILYEIAKKKKLKTVICSGCSFTNKFFIFSDLDEWGSFNKNPDINKNPINSEDRLKYSRKVKDLVYSHEKKWKKKYKLFTSLKLKLINFLIYLKILKRAHVELQKKYLNNLTSATLNDDEFKNLFNLNKKIAIFALHYEPEAATNILGNQFHDQVLAIETLDSLLNEDWIILVKEHLDPPQGYKFRGELFFRRLNKIKRLYFIDKNYNLIDIIKKVDLISTITGTAGWEALNQEKKCLIFGNAWYQEIHGCIKYNKNFSYDIFLDKFNTKYNKIDFDESLFQLSKKLGEGIVDEYFVQMIDNFNYLKNAEVVTQSIVNFLERSKN